MGLFTNRMRQKPSPPSPDVYELPGTPVSLGLLSGPEAPRLSAIPENQGTASDTASSPGSSPGIKVVRQFSVTSVWTRRTMSTRSKPPRPSNDTKPPPYIKHEWVSEPLSEDGDEKEMENGRLATERLSRRGGWGRVLLMVGAVLLLAIVLGVGLGVGLNHHKSTTSSSSSSSSSSGSSGSTPDTSTQSFPIGEYSLVTALRNVQTSCTSNAATWRCYPYTVYSASDSSTIDGSLTALNWVLTNTSSHYASNLTTTTTSSTGIPANMSISSSTNPFSITFSDIALTYINNDTNPRYTFSHTMSQEIVPTVALTSDNSASVCYYNNTVLTGTLYLSSALAQDAPTNSSYAASLASYTTWPFAVHIEEVAAGGTDVPACYFTNKGVVGARITSGFTTEAAGDTCFCDYRNYG